MKKYNITDLLDGEILIENNGEEKAIELKGIEIPIIQRDYAHGRDTVDVIRVRNRFIKAIFDALENGTELELDFVYGSISEVVKGSEKHNVFMPLDGQQRLTTIYLIYWFIINTELEGDDLNKNREILSNFSYATRATASSFCEKLSVIGYTSNPIKEIKDAYWFHDIYKLDPTVVGMLNMLNDIQVEYQTRTEKLFSALKNICFYILPLDGFDLTDELYIKMNARGKPLTNFENYKADLINWIKSNQNPDSKKFQEVVTFNGLDCPWYLSIASKFDNSWTDIFWSSLESNNNKKDITIDDEFLRFLNRFLLNQFILPADGTPKAIEAHNIFQKLYYKSDFGLFKYESNDDYIKLLTSKNIKSLEKVLDSLSKHGSQISKCITPSWDPNFNWNLYGEEYTQTQQLVFASVILYLQNADFEDQRFKEWMRICWNIIIDPDIRNIDRLITAMKFIGKLAEDAGDIYEGLKKEKYKSLIESSNNIHGIQLSEEIKKIQLINKGKSWELSIYEAESHSLFQGNIGFLLSDNLGLDEFKSRLKMAQKLFNKSGAVEILNKNHETLRYCISQFKDWKTIEYFNYNDIASNWQLILRRHQSVKESIKYLCDHKIEDLGSLINPALNKQSLSTAWDEKRVRKIHENLYCDPVFFKWIQTGVEKKSIHKIRFRNDRIYIIRPSAWYDKVLLEGCRNEIINSLENKLNINFDNKCGDSNFYYLEKFTHELEYGGKKIQLQFTDDHKLFINNLVTNEDKIQEWNTVINGEFVLSYIKRTEEVESMVDDILQLL